MAWTYRVVGYVHAGLLFLSLSSGEVDTAAMWGMAVLTVLGVGMANIIEEIRKGRS